MAGLYFDGLKNTKRSAAGYHMSRILKYADRYGADVVAGALVHAARFDAYSADAILRIIQGKKLKSTARKAVRESIPANVREFLRTCSVEKDKPERYDHLINSEPKGIKDELNAE